MVENKPHNKLGQRHGRWETNNTSMIYIRYFIADEFYGFSYFYSKFSKIEEKEYYAK